MFDALLNISVYAIFAFVMSWMARQSQYAVETGEISQNKLDGWLWAFILFFTFIMGTRWNVGSDNITYINHFANGISLKNNEILYKELVDFVRLNGFHWAVGMCLMAFLQIFFVVEALKRYRYILIFLPFVLFGCRYWQDYTGACRQMIAASVFLWSIRFVVKKQYLYYLLFIYLASMIHNSVIILLPLVFLPSKINLRKFRTIMLIVFGMCVALGYLQKVSFMQSVLSPIIGGSVYADGNIGSSMKDILDSGQSREVLSYGPMMISSIVLSFFIIWYYPKMRDALRAYIPEFDIWFALAYFYGCFYFLICNLGHIFIRPTQYFEVFQMVMASVLFYYLWNQYKRFLISKWPVVLYSLVIAIGMFSDVYKNTGIPWEATSYKSMFFHQADRNRFGFK